MIKILYGNEPYRIDFERKKITGQVKNPAMNYTRVCGTFDDKLLSLCRTYPFLEEKRVVLLDIDTLKGIDTDAFREFLENPSGSTDLLIICRKVDTRLKVYKEVKEFAVPCDKVKNPEDLKKCILFEVSKAGAKITGGAVKALISRMNYFDREDINFLNVSEYIKTLAGISPEITEDMVKKYVPSYEEADVYSLAGLIKNHQMDALLRQINLLNRENAINMLSLLLYSFRVAYKEMYFPRGEIGGTPSVFSTCRKEKLCGAIKILTDNIAAVKSGYIPEDLALKNAVGALTTII